MREALLVFCSAQYDELSLAVFCVIGGERGFSPSEFSVPLCYAGSQNVYSLIVSYNCGNSISGLLYYVAVWFCRVFLLCDGDSELKFPRELHVPHRSSLSNLGDTTKTSIDED